MHKLERLVAAAEPLVEHHLCHVDRPPFGKDPGTERSAKGAIRLVRRSKLQIVTGDRLMDGEQREHAIVVFAKHGLHLFGRGVVCWRRHIEEARFALVERARRVEEGPAIRAQESRRPRDLKRFAREVEQARALDERLASRGLFAASIQEICRRRVFAPDRMQHRTDETMGIALHACRLSLADPVRCDLARNLDDAFANRHELSLRRTLDRRAIVRSEERVSQRAVIAGGTVATLAGAARQHLVPQPLREPLRRGPRRIRRSSQFISVDLDAHLRELGDPRRLFDRGLGVKSTDRSRGERQLATRSRLAGATQRAVIRRNAQLGDADKGVDRLLERVRERAQTRGKIFRAPLSAPEGARDQREESTADRRHGVERIPRRGANLGALEANRGQGGECQISIRTIISVKIGLRDALEASRLLVYPCHHARICRRPDPIPRAVVVVDAGRRCRNGMQGGEAGEEARRVEPIRVHRGRVPSAHGRPRHNRCLFRAAERGQPRRGAQAHGRARGDANPCR